MESFEIETGTQFLKLFVQKITLAYIPFPFTFSYRKKLKHKHHKFKCTSLNKKPFAIIAKWYAISNQSHQNEDIDLT
jgi:hypothetical protein